MSLKLTIIVPCYNEQQHIEACLSSLLDNEFDRNLWEILVIDGMSDDRTRDIVAQFGQRHPFVRLVDNPERLKPIALNRGIRLAKGEFVMRVDAHSTYAHGYVDRLFAEIEKGEVQNVGGVQVADCSGLGHWGTAIATAVSHPIAMGNAVHRFEGLPEPRLVNTVYCGCYPKYVFDNIGLFNEKLIRTQDRELNERLLRTGGRIKLLPDVHAMYRPRSSLGSYVKWTFEGAKWLFMARHFTDVSMVRWRNLIPLAFLFYIVGLLVVWIYPTSFSFKMLSSVPALAYLAIIFFAGLRAGLAKSLGHLVLTFPLVVLLTHLSYGVGSLAGILSSGK